MTLDQFLKKKLTLNEIFKYDSTKALINTVTQFEPIEFVEFSKFNQYIKNYENNEFISRLPKIFLPFNQKKLRAFEILNSNSFFDGDIVVCETLNESKPHDVYYLYLNEEGLFLSEKIPAKKNFFQIWRVIAIISKSTYKYKILSKLDKIT